MCALGIVQLSAPGSVFLSLIEFHLMYYSLVLKTFKGTHYGDFWSSFFLYFSPLQYSASHIPTALGFPKSNLCLLNSVITMLCYVPHPCTTIQKVPTGCPLCFLSGIRVLYYLLYKVGNNFYTFCPVFHYKRASPVLINLS